MGNRKHGVINTHLNPFDEDARAREALFLATEVEGLAIVSQLLGAAAIHYITAMDANGLSRDDRYSRRLLKFLNTTGNIRYIGSDGGLRYDASDLLKSQGFIDAAVARRANRRTFPARTDTEPFPPYMRLDKIYVPHALKQAIKKVKVLRNRQTKKISDHYPLKAQIRVPV